MRVAIDRYMRGCRYKDKDQEVSVGFLSAIKKSKSRVSVHELGHHASEMGIYHSKVRWQNALNDPLVSVAGSLVNTNIPKYHWGYFRAHY